MAEFTEEEKCIIQWMYETANSMAELVDIKLNGYGISSNDIYVLFKKLGLIDVVFEV